MRCHGEDFERANRRIRDSEIAPKSVPTRRALSVACDRIQENQRPTRVVAAAGRRVDYTLTIGPRETTGKLEPGILVDLRVPSDRNGVVS